VRVLTLRCTECRTTIEAWVMAVRTDDAVACIVGESCAGAPVARPPFEGWASSVVEVVEKVSAEAAEQRYQAGKPVTCSANATSCSASSGSRNPSATSSSARAFTLAT
jgi:hypothetical protein